MNSDQSKLERLRADIAAIGQTRLLKVLLVDDDDASRLLVKDILRTYKLLLAEAESGEQAIAELERQSFDIVLLDVKMPGMDGLTTYAQIKDKWPAVRVFIVTGYMEWPGLKEAVKRGVVQIVGKEFLQKALTSIFEPLCATKTN